jgi:hypothetical protein
LPVETIFTASRKVGQPHQHAQNIIHEIPYAPSILPNLKSFSKCE